MKTKAVVCMALMFLLISALPLSVSYAGTTWDIKTVDSGDVGYYSSLALDSNGNPCISYLDGANFDLKYARWTGSAWNIQTVDSGGIVGYDTSLVMDFSGSPCISYYDYTNGDLKYARWTGSSWSIQIVDSTGNVGSYSSLALNSNGYPCISYYDWTNGDLKYARWAGSAWNIQTVDSAGSVGAHTSLALDSKGNPSISYYDMWNLELKFARWTGSTWSVETVDSAGIVGDYSSLALDSNGNPCISYYDYTNGGVKYAKWTGSAWSIQSVDYVGDLKEYTSLALGSDGNPHISYLDGPSGALKYARWTGSAWLIQTVYSAGNVTTYASLLLDSNGNPHISFLDHTIRVLKYTFGQTIPSTPTGSVVINSEDAFTTSQTVMLSLTYTAYGSSVSQVHYSNDGVSWTAWEAPAASKLWSLLPGDGSKTVYFQVRDSDGILSSTYLDTITLDTSAPQGSIQINNGAAYTNSTIVSLELLADDAGSGVSQMCFSNDYGVWSGWELYSPSRFWGLTAGDGEKNVRVQYKDQVDLTVMAYDIITLDGTLPVANAGQNKSVMVGQSVAFNGSGSTDNLGIASYLWGFGDGSTGSGVAPTHTYSSVGNYTVTLMVKDLAGNSAASSSTVAVEVVIPEFPSAATLVLFFILTSALATGFRGEFKLGKHTS